MLWFILGLAVIAGLGALVWRQRRRGADWRREISFFVDLVALGATALIVGALALVQLRDAPPVQGPLTVAQSTATRPARPSRTPRTTPSPSRTVEDADVSPTVTISATVEVSATVTASSPATTTHTVAAGETLGAIAAQYDVSLLALREANGITGDSLSVGQQLVIPLPTPVASATPEVTATLTVEATPTITATAEVTATATRTPRISPTPVPPTATASTTTTTYTVQAGDTLRAIAERFGTTTAAIVALNPGLNPDSLRVGTVLTIPASGSGAGSAPAATAAPQRGTVNYTVQQGDLLSTIARRFGVTTQQIIAANPGIDADNLRVGQVLRIPNQPLP